MAVHQAHLITERAGATDWRRALPSLTDPGVLLRELRRADAASLLSQFEDASVLQYLSPGPASIEQFRLFIRWTHEERRHGRHACYGIVPAGSTHAVGILQVWPIERDFSTAEWGFVVGAGYWGTGLFARAATRLLDAIFLEGLFGPPGVYRLEARSVDSNARGNAALRKLGATAEGLLRGGFREYGGVQDHVMWSLLAPEWRARRPPRAE